MNNWLYFTELLRRALNEPDSVRTSQVSLGAERGAHAYSGDSPGAAQAQLHLSPGSPRRAGKGKGEVESRRNMHGDTVRVWDRKR